MIDNMDKTKSGFRTRIRKISAKAAVYLILSVAVLAILIPFYVILITSFKTNKEASNMAFSWWPREGFHFDGYKEILFTSRGGTSIILGLFNTLWMSIPPTLVGLFVSALSAYAYAKVNFKGKNLLFSLQMATMMLPAVITMTSTYLVFDMIGWIDTPLPIVVPGMFGSIGTIFFLRQYFIGIPTDLCDAASIDGAGRFTIFLKIILPLAFPALFAQGLIGFIGRYNDYLAPLLYLKSPEWYTLQIALRFYWGMVVAERQVVMAGAVVAILPLLIVYLFAQNQVISGIQMNAGLKG